MKGSPAVPGGLLTSKPMRFITPWVSDRVGFFLLPRSRTARPLQPAGNEGDGDLDMKPELSGPDRRTYAAIFLHPAARTPGRRDARSILGVQANVVEEAVASRRTADSPTARGSNR